MTASPRRQGRGLCPRELGWAGWLEVTSIGLRQVGPRCVNHSPATWAGRGRRRAGRRGGRRAPGSPCGRAGTESGPGRAGQGWGRAGSTRKPPGQKEVGVSRPEAVSEGPEQEGPASQLSAAPERAQATGACRNVITSLEAPPGLNPCPSPAACPPLEPVYPWSVATVDSPFT